MAGAELRVLVPLDGSALEKEARTVLAAVPDTVWSRSEDGHLLQARFSADIGEVLHEQLRRLVDAGVGTHARSAISVWPSSLLLYGTRSGGNNSSSNNNGGVGRGGSVGSNTPCASPTPISLSNANTSDSGFVSKPDDEAGIGGTHDAACGWYDFLGSVAERLAMARAVQAAEADARLSFDFVCLLFIAAFLAALGLVENSTEILVASMLISPLMGPIMAFTLGTLASERRLQRRGVRVELLGLAGCLLLGFLFGLATAGVAGGVPELWPTREMRSRGRLHAMWVGALVALLSGAAIALATLGGYTASLVGVAISAALLPPAVNAGLLWSLACTALLTDEENVDFGAADISDFTNSSSPLSSDTVQPRRLIPSDLALKGGLSFCLTILNIICIYLAAVLVLKLKHVTPGTEERLLRSEELRWAGEERAAQSPPHWQWPPTRKSLAHKSLARRASLLLPSTVTTDLLSGYDSNTRTWSPGGGGSRPSLNELRNMYRWSHGPSGTVTTQSSSTDRAQAAPASASDVQPPLASARLQSPQSPPAADCRSPGRRFIASTVTLPTIREARHSPSPPQAPTSQSVKKASATLPRFVVTPSAHDPLLDD